MCGARHRCWVTLPVQLANGFIPGNFAGHTLLAIPGDPHNEGVGFRLACVAFVSFTASSPALAEQKKPTGVFKKTTCEQRHDTCIQLA